MTFSYRRCWRTTSAGKPISTSHADPADVDALRAVADYVIALPSDDPLIMLAATIVPTAFAVLQFGPPTTEMPTPPEPESVNRMEWSVQSPRETLIVFLAAVATDLDRATTAARDEANRERRLRRHAQRQGLRIAKRQSPESICGPIVWYEVLASGNSQPVTTVQDLDELEGFLMHFAAEGPS